MSILNEPDIRRGILADIGIGAAVSAVSFSFGIAAGIAALASCLIYTVIHAITNVRRYRAIARLSSSIDRILHGQDEILFTDSREGELAILTSEVTKMTVRLREQTDALAADKVRLTDAIADISHQLRTPLTSMNLTVSLLSEDGLSDERRLRLTRDLSRSLRRIDWLIDALLKISKIDAGTVEFRSERVSVAELIRRAAAPLMIPMELRGQELGIHADSEEYTGDMQWSVEAIGNILKNCVEHTPEGGSIEISAAENALFTEIVISDSGAGFEPGDIPHRFERFYRGKNADAASVGIGLALARTVIAAQNGTVAASNGKNGGAQFTVRFYKNIV